jgi:hypothetical protein
LLGRNDHSIALNAAQQFFDRELAEPDMDGAWRHFAPCVFGAARTYAEFRAMIRGVR